MGLYATMVILSSGIFFGSGTADGFCLYDDRDWIEGGLDIFHESWGLEFDEGPTARCYSEEEKIAFVALTVGLGIIFISVICCIACCCNTKSPRRPTSVVVVRRLKRSLEV